MFAPLLLACALAPPDPAVVPPDPPAADVVVYGATSGGIAAVVQARRSGRTAILAEPSNHLGGLTTGGLGATDIGNKAAVGGIAREFYERVAAKYADPAAWTWQDAADYRSPRGDAVRIGEENPPAMWTFEPHVASRVFGEMLAEAGVEPLTNAPLDRTPGGVTVEDGRIVSFTLKDGRTVRGNVFIDATYEGDLAAAAGATTTVGREAESVYGESYNGVRPGLNVKNHRFVVPVDPYVAAGDPASGLLPDVRETPLPPPGSGDDGVQAYCYRLCATDVPANRLPWPKPADYDESLYELLFRNFEAGDLRRPWNPVMMPNRKTDANNNHAVSTDWIGRNHAYPEASDEQRAAILAAHESYQQGLVWSLANHPRVPAEVRAYFSNWGPAKDEFPETGGWPPQLYIREARRLVGDLVMTQAHCEGRAVADRPIGLAAYTMDSHNVWRYVTPEGFVQNEGDVQRGGFPPYPIGFGAILPRRGEANNLLVPVALSASHIAYGSIRMEPVFMVLGQSAATAAGLAIEEGVAVRDVPYPALRERLEADGQVLEWTGPKGAKRIPVGSMEGVAADDADAIFTGDWRESRSVGLYVGRGYRVAKWDGGGEAPYATFRLTVPKAGRYEMRWSWTAHPNRCRKVTIAVRRQSDLAIFGLPWNVDQRRTPENPPFETLLGLYEFDAGQELAVTVQAADEGFVVADAVQLLPIDGDD